MNIVKLGYVGCGFMGQKVHLPNFSSLPGCELIALAEVREELGRRVQKRFGIERLYAHHLQMAKDRDIDAFAVSAAFGLQTEIAKDLLRTGRPVFMEKPMAVSVEAAEELLEAAETGGARLMVGYMKRFDGGNELAKETVSRYRSTGELGKVTFARAHGFCGDWICGLDTQMDQTDEPKPDGKASGPAWLPAEFLQAYLSYLQQYTHNLNLLRYLLDAGDRVAVRFVDLDRDGYTGIVSFDMDGVRAVLETGLLRYHSWDEHTQVYFDRGWVKTWAPPLLHKNLPAEVEIYRGGDEHVYLRPLPKDRWSWAFRREAEHFIEGVQSERDFLSSAQDTMTDVRLFEQIYRRHLEAQGVL
jgi:predicted dehydrogenase